MKEGVNPGENEANFKAGAEKKGARQIDDFRGIFLDPGKFEPKDMSKSLKNAGIKTFGIFIDPD